MSLLLILLAQTSISLALLGAYLFSQVVKNLPAKQESLGSIPGLGRSPGGGNCNPLQYSCLENPMDRGAWWTTVHGVAKSQIWLTDWHTSLVKLSLIKIPNKKHSTSSDSDPSFLYLFCSIILSTWNLYFVYFILYFSTEDVSFLRPNTLEFCSWLYLCYILKLWKY